ncbi:putative secreted protein [Caballeronia sordidicola]|uniref:Putative secreted protein n=2 Tax=Caballeronia sordidicola TaxID=196367 RepID=A0A242MWR8_CABSO|nr:putative secreted protein [Caballeronia sordidicola]
MLAAGAVNARGFDVQCNYSHTLPDDAIVYPGKPGEAMVHEFFGNPNANAYTTYDSLNNNKVTTCNSAADVSAYWAPQLKRKSGIVFPTYQKTYYLNDQPVVPVQPIPPGLEMLAGDHMGTGPNPRVIPVLGRPVHNVDADELPA